MADPLSRTLVLRTANNYKNNKNRRWPLRVWETLTVDVGFNCLTHVLFLMHVLFTVSRDLYFSYPNPVSLVHLSVCFSVVWVRSRSSAVMVFTTKRWLNAVTWSFSRPGPVAGAWGHGLPGVRPWPLVDLLTSADISGPLCWKTDAASCDMTVTPAALRAVMTNQGQQRVEVVQDRFGDCWVNGMWQSAESRDSCQQRLSDLDSVSLIDCLLIC